ncbi:ATP-binding cassette domain-containing protein [Heyndrickxia sp. NPDC080065]|uniref:ATP-binding cassette domain-containing protein n=1 Tax=Heyndrickxia sp. NPDC080065 TaxID=3390568 RepID=UPI003D069A89
MTLLKVDQLSIFNNGHVPLVRSISFTVNRNQIAGIVGRSGSGKTLTAKALINRLPHNLYKKGEIVYKNGLNNDQQPLCGKHIGMIMQNPLDAFNPSKKICYHFRESLKVHKPMSKKSMDLKSIEMMQKLHIENANEVYYKHPFELSGGMLQRIMIAITLVVEPSIIIADEPTTALDTMNRKNLIKLFKEIRDMYQTSILIITHDLNFVAALADEVFVMKDGEIVDRGSTKHIFNNSTHPYTEKLCQLALQ